MAWTPLVPSLVEQLLQQSIPLRKPLRQWSSMLQGASLQSLWLAGLLPALTAIGYNARMAKRSASMTRVFNPTPLWIGSWTHPRSELEELIRLTLRSATAAGGGHSGLSVTGSGGSQPLRRIMTATSASIVCAWRNAPRPLRSTSMTLTCGSSFCNKKGHCAGRSANVPLTMNGAATAHECNRTPLWVWNVPSTRSLMILAT